MHSKLLATAIAVALGAFSVSAVAAPQSSKADEVAQLKAQMAAMQAGMAAMQAKIDELQAHDSQQTQVNATQAQAIQSTQLQVAAASTLAQNAATAKNGPFTYKGVTITPGGFFELDSIYRSRNIGSDIFSSYSGIPYRNAPGGTLAEYRMTARASRLSLLVQGDVSPTTHLAGFADFDFLGAPQNANPVESNSYSPRVRNAYLTADWDTSGLHLLAGQSWSMAVLNGVGITPRSEVLPPTIDLQVVPGFVWTRQAQVRLVKDWNQTWWFGLSLENPQTSIYNSPNAAKAPVIPVNTITAGSGFDTNNSLTATHVPDVIAKLAVDPGWGHYEIYAMGRDFYNHYSGASHDVYGGGVGGGMILPLVPKMLDFQLTGLAGRGIGRYGTSLLSDVTVNPNGALAPIKESMIEAGLTFHANPDWDFYGFAGREKEDKQAFNVNGVPFGYGNPLYNNAGCDIDGAAAATCVGNTKQIWQATAGLWWKFYQGKYGKMQFGAQYSYTKREAFEGVGGAPTTDDNMFFTSFRYTPF